jgi:cardiolipin synthase
VEPLGRRALARRPVVEQGPQPNATEVESARAARARARRGRFLGRFLGRIARAGSVLGRALVGQRTVGREDRSWIVLIAASLLLASALGFLAPRVLAWPLAFLLFWLGVASLVRAYQSRGRG